MIYTSEPKFVPVTVRGQQIWMDEDKFGTMAMFRSERLVDGRRYNTGTVVRDQFADAGERLVSGGGATVWELSIFYDQYDMEKCFGKNWDASLPGESRPIKR